MPTSDPAIAPARPRIPTGQELFDTLMAHIEPELTSEGLKTLTEKYKDETVPQFAERQKRYEVAFERYDQAYQGYIQTLNSQVEQYRRDSFRKAEFDDRSSEDGRLQSLSKSFA